MGGKRQTDGRANVPTGRVTSQCSGIGSQIARAMSAFEYTWRKIVRRSTPAILCADGITATPMQVTR